MSVWAMQLKPNDAQNAFDFCKSQGIIGFGWGLKKNCPAENREDYLKKAEEKYSARDYKKLVATLSAMDRLVAGDIVWVRSDEGLYFICEITNNECFYSEDEYHYRAGITHYKNCAFYLVGFGLIGLVDLVPSQVKWLFERNWVLWCNHKADYKRRSSRV